jgi:hypothetical protein
MAKLSQMSEVKEDSATTAEVRPNENRRFKGRIHCRLSTSAADFSPLLPDNLSGFAALRSKMFLDNRFYFGPPGRVFGQEFLCTGKSQANRQHLELFLIGWKLRHRAIGHPPQN